VIGLLCAGTFVDDQDIGRALMGGSSYAWDRQADELRGHRARNGAWISGDGPINTRTSSILTLVNLTPYGCAAVEPTLWTNCWARRPLAIGFPWRRMETTVSGQIIEHPATSTAADVLGLSPRWPASA